MALCTAPWLAANRREERGERWERGRECHQHMNPPDTQDQVGSKRKDLGESVCREICEDIRRSIEYSLENPDAALKDAIKWGRGIDEDTNEEFVKMYVNRRTIDYGEDGRSAVRMFLERGIEVGLVRSDFDTSGLKFIGEGEND